MLRADDTHRQPPSFDVGSDLASSGTAVSLPAASSGQPLEHPVNQSPDDEVPMADVVVDLGSRSVSLRTLLNTRLLVQASSGGGKTYLLRRLVEQSAEHVQIIVLDIEGDLASLRELPIPFIYCAVGEPIQPRNETAQQLALTLRQTRASIIIDLSELEPDDKKTYSALFLSALLDAPKETWAPCLLVLDEAHVLAGQRGFAVAKGEPCSKRAVEGIACRGRKRGLGLVMATQRLSKLNKDVAAEALNCLIGLTALKNDLASAADQLGMGLKEAADLLRGLPPGNFYGHGPALTPDVSLLKVGPVRTTHGTNATRIMIPAVTDIGAAVAQLQAIEAAASIAQKAAEDSAANLSRQPANAPGPNGAPRQAQPSPKPRQPSPIQAAAVARLKAIPSKPRRIRGEAIRAEAERCNVSIATIYNWVAADARSSPPVRRTPAPTHRGRLRHKRLSAIRRRRIQDKLLKGPRRELAQRIRALVASTGLSKSTLYRMASARTKRPASKRKPRK